MSVEEQNLNAPTPFRKFSIVVETYNLGEGSEKERLEESLRSAVGIASRHGGEVLLADSSGDQRAHDLLREMFPEVLHVDSVGFGYDDAKLKAADQAKGEYVLFLDGDCRPDSGSEWLYAHLAHLRGGGNAGGGFTRYEGGFLETVKTVMDFGFLLPVRERVLDCYASNNCGFRREVLLSSRVEPGQLRCSCYLHAQALRRAGTPVQMVPDARVLHEPQPLIGERFRQGHDAIVACWQDPEMPQSRWLRYGLAAAPAFYAKDVYHDLKRMLLGRADLGLSVPQAIAALPLFPLLRLIDLAGMVKGLREVSASA